MYPEPHDDLREHRDWLLSFVHLPPGGTLVDLGCGSGADLPALDGRYFSGITGYVYVRRRRRVP